MDRLPLILFLVATVGCGGGSGGQADLLPETLVADAGPVDAHSDLSDAGTVDDASLEVAPDPGTDEAEATVEPLPTLPPGLQVSTRYAAGAASATADPPDGAGHFPGGFGFCAGNEAACRVSEGQHDSLWVVAVALADPENGEVVVFVGIDSLGLI